MGYDALQPLPPMGPVADRRDLLVSLARDRRVVHLGCVDDRLAEERLRTGQHLHAALAGAAADLTGVDISSAGVELVRAAVPGRYVVADVEDLPVDDLPGDTELVIASELIEHLPNPGRFLGGLQRYLARTGAAGVITTPNAYSWQSFGRMLASRREPVHPDHLLVYSPFTLVRSLEAAGLRVDWLRPHAWLRHERARSRALGAVDRVVLRARPSLSLGLIAQVSATARATTT